MRTIDASMLTTELSSLPTHVPRVVVSGNLATPWTLLEVLDEVLPEYRLFVLNVQTPPPDRPGVIVETPFVGPGVRDRSERIEYLPMRLSLVPRLFTSTHPPDVVVVHTTPPQGGLLSLGIEVNILPAAIAATRRRGGLVIAQLNPEMPFTTGDATLAVDEIDLAVEVPAPLPEAPLASSTTAAEEIGRRAASFVEDGGTLQLGIGSIPDAVTRQLERRRGLGLWSEMLSDGVMGLERQGALDERRAICATFLLGSAELYLWADANPRLVLQRTERINDPAQIAAQPGMVSINGAIEVDLFAQSNASHRAGRVYSGFGGQPDFVSGALHSNGGHALIVLEAWHEPTEASKIVPLLRSPATSFQHSAIVTEFGTAQLFGKSAHEQALVLARRAADPRARAMLEAAAAHQSEHHDRPPNAPPL